MVLDLPLNSSELFPFREGTGFAVFHQRTARHKHNFKINWYGIHVTKADLKI